VTAKLFQRLPDFKGKRRLARLVLYDYLAHATDIRVTSKGGSIFFLPNAKENIGFELLINGDYEPDTVQFILSKLPAGKSFLDIGANIGSIAIPVARARPEVKVIGVEASPRIAAYLRRNLAINQLNNFIVFERAMSNESGQVLNFFSPDEKFGKGSLSPVFTDNSTQVVSITLDELIQTPGCEAGLIKVDIEGYEYFAFEGGKETLSKPQAPDIYFEFVDWCEKAAGLEPGSSQRVLQSYGYKLYERVGNRLNKLESVAVSGSKMLFATKS
jgi:FkbM family methyltransferase